MAEQKLQILKIDFILNTPIITNWGLYKYWLYDKQSSKLELHNAISAVGHESTAKLLSKLLDYPVKANRVEIHMGVGQIALVFSLKQRQSEGKILSLSVLKELKFELGIMKRIK